MPAFGGGFWSASAVALPTVAKPAGTYDLFAFAGNAGIRGFDAFLR